MYPELGSTKYHLKAAQVALSLDTENLKRSDVTKYFHHIYNFEK